MRKPPVTSPDPKAVKEALDLFVVELEEDGRTSFTFQEAEALADELGFSTAVEVIAGLRGRGLAMDERKPAKRVRGFTANSHDRYCDPANKTHGGSGYEQINGFAGQTG